MRVSLVAFLFLLTLPGLSQSKEAFLMYEISDFYKSDTTFRLDEFVVFDKKKITIRSFPSSLNYETRKRRAKYTRVGEQITFFDEGKSKVAEILRGPIFKGGSKARYVLVPIKNMGLKVTPFEGQLIEHYSSGGKMKIIIDTLRSRSRQYTYSINFGQQRSLFNGWYPMIYLDDKYSNLTSLPGLLGWFQLNKTIADSIWDIRGYSLIVHKGDSAYWEGMFTKADLLSKSALKRITENLQGKWSQTRGFELNGKLAPDSSEVIRFLDSLKVCKYTFTFNKDNLILTRSSLNPEMNSLDTLGYSINSTGDWIWTKGKNDVDIILDKIDSKSARFSVIDDYGIDNKTCTGYLVLYLRREE